MKQHFSIIVMLAIMALAFQAEAGALPTAITLSKLSKGATGVVMSVTLTPASNLANDGKIVITIPGNGLALANPPATLSFTAPTSGSPAGTAALVGQVLTVTMTAGTFTGGAAITFTIPGFTNPTAAQNALTNVAAATTAADGTTIVGLSSVGAYPAILGNLGTASPAITLSNKTKGATSVNMTVSLTPEATVASNGKILITIAGTGLALTGPGTLTFTAPTSGSPAGTAALAGQVLTVTMSTGTFTGGVAITFTIPGFTNPTAAQNSLTNVAAATTAADGTLVGLSSVGTYPAILDPSAPITSAAAPITSAAAPPSTTTNNGTSPGPGPAPAPTTKASASFVASSAALLVAAIIVGVLL